MKKIVFVSIIAALLCGCAEEGQTEKTVLNDEMKVEAKEEEQAKEITDREDSRLLKTNYLEDDVLESKKVFRYDEKDNVIELIFYDRNDSLYTWKNIIRYDEQGKKTHDESYRAEYLQGTTVFTYDKQGNNISKQVNESDGSLRWEELYKFNERGNKIKLYGPGGTTRWSYDEPGNLIQKISGKEVCQFEYDTAGNRIEERYYKLIPAGPRYCSNDNEYHLVRLETKKYDENGKKIEQRTRVQDPNLPESGCLDSNGDLIKKGEFGLESVSTIKYNNNGKMVESVHFNSADSLAYSSRYKFNKNGNKIEHIYHRGDGSLDIRYLYKYDETGNIMEEITERDDVLRVTTYKHDKRGNKIEEANYYLGSVTLSMYILSNKE